MAKGNNKDVQRFRFRRDMDLGSIDAETDQKFLQAAFVDNGYMDTVSDTTDRKSVLVGRTGAGKTALLLRLEDVENRVVRISPEALSMRYLGDSIVRDLAEAGVRMNLFYKLLWRHVIAVEIIKVHYGIHSPEKQKNWITTLINAFRSTDARKERAIRYLEQWGSDFWKGSHERVKEIVVELEKQLDVSLEGGAKLAKGGLGAGQRVKETQVKEVVNQAQKVVENIRIEHLDNILKLLDEDAFNDPMKPYYVLVDDLDKDWVDADFAYDLTEALVEEVKEFASRENVKLVVALRENIVDQMHSRIKASGRGRQREKHETLMLRLKWKPADLVQVLNERLQVLVRGHYGGDLTVHDIFPSGSRNQLSGVDYVLQRTLMRPRDAIQLVNMCIKEAEGSGAITWEAVEAAERRYSRERVRSLEDEWRENFPGIGALLQALAGLPDGFSLTALMEDKERLVQVYAEGERAKDEQGNVARMASNLAGKEGEEEAVEWILTVLFRTSALGARIPPGDDIVFSYVERDLLDHGVTPGTLFFFHPALYEALAVKDPFYKRDIQGTTVEYPGPVD